jgi:protein SCO1/2
MQAPDFALTDHTGKSWNLAAQKGKTIALFFGYTHCPDTCPATLALLSRAVRDAKADGKTQIAFVTVDPKRDTPATLAAYVKKFDGPVVGLTGSRAQVEAVERSYHQWAQKIPGKHGDDNYDDAHSSTIFLIDRSGNERVLHDPADTVDAVASDLRELNS